MFRRVRTSGGQRIMKLIPPVNTLVFRVVVMGVCLWFENPIACLFEQVVMPEHFIFW